MIEIQKLSEEDRESAMCMMGGYLHGNCYVYALALNAGLGWPIIGLMRGDEIHHAGVRSPDGRFMDARGFVKESEITEPFSTVTIDCLKEVRAEDLHPNPMMLADNIDAATERAQIVYPDLPWVEGTPMRRIQDFAVKLEELCREHGVWIREMLPTARPVVYLAHNEDDFEKGYNFSPVMNGGGYFLSRRTR